MGTLSQKFKPRILEHLYGRPITRLHCDHVILLHQSAVSIEIASLQVVGTLSQKFKTSILEDLYGQPIRHPPLEHVICLNQSAFTPFLWMEGTFSHPPKLGVSLTLSTSQNAPFHEICPYLGMRVYLSQKPHFPTTEVCSRILQGLLSVGSYSNMASEVLS